MDLHEQGATNLPQNNIYRVNKHLSVDLEHHVSIRVFKWAAEISIGKPDGDNWIQANGVILFRVSIDSATTTELFAVPYTMEDMKGRGLLVVLHETVKRLHMQDSLKNLPWIAYDLLLRELSLKFGLTHQLLKRYSDDVLVMFMDLKINPASRVIGCSSESMEDAIQESCSKRMPHISILQVNAETNLENVKEIEECLKVCPGMVVEESRGMEEVKSFAEIGVLTATEENVAECCICLDMLSVGFRYVTTCCGHKFHKVCLANWLLNRINRKVSCPLCRNTLYFS